jgi:hypothetical protein
MTGESDDPIVTPSVYSYNWPLKLKKEVVRIWGKIRKIASSKCRLRRCRNDIKADKDVSGSNSKSVNRVDELH